MEGVECLPWDDERSEYSQLGSSNYCRNPGPPGYEEEGPWCYTNHQHIVWGYCGVMRCEEGKFLGKGFASVKAHCQFG